MCEREDCLKPSDLCLKNCDMPFSVREALAA